MKNYFKIWLFLCIVVSNGYAQQEETNKTEKDSIAVPYYPFDNLKDGTLYLNNPIEKEVKYKPSIARYIVRENIGTTRFTTPKYYTEEEYRDYRLRKDIQDYFREKSAAIDGKKKNSEAAQKDLLPTMYVNSKFFETLFGGTEIKLIPQGSLTIRAGLQYQNIENPLISEENRKSYTPEFDQQLRANITAQVGKRLTANINYDTQSTFSFQNQMKLDFEPDEDDLIRNIEVGNVNMEIKNNLINGSQSLFGVKAQLQFGATSVTGVFSQQQSQAKNIVAEGASAITEFELRTTQYDSNRHFFLAQYFRNHYNTALENLPLINSTIQITKLEVWVTNRNTNTEDVRNIVGLVDLGESGIDVYDATKSNITNEIAATQAADAQLIPRNDENSLSQYIGTDKTQLREIQNVYSQLSSLEQGSEYTIVENARKLGSDEYTYNKQLGYVSLNSRLSDGDVLAIAFEYTYNGQVYRVGELSTDGIASDENLVVKLIRPQLIDPEATVWNLMMKNVYSIGAYNLQQSDFKMNLLYKEDATGQATNNLLLAEEDTTDDLKTAIQERTLLNVTGLDRLDANGNKTRSLTSVNNDLFDKGDGFFDFIEGITVNSTNGYVIFPSIEPFGRDLENQLSNDNDVDKYPFNELYTTTAAVAENDYQDKDKFFVKGTYTSSGDEGISLGAFNVPRGSVTVTSGGITLIEGVDYTVDYTMGRVKIINPAIEASGQSVNVSLENNTFFNQQQKTFIGIDVEHKFSDDFILGATYLNIKEQPISNKVQLGQDPINNSMYGLNLSYSSEVPFLTDMVNYLPNIDTDAPSTISVRGDIAYLRPGTPSSIDIGGEATTYIDDFEGAQLPISLGSAQSWSLSSVPLTGLDSRDYGLGIDNTVSNSLDTGKKRAKLSWYNVDQLFYYDSSLKPSNIDNEELSRAETRPIRNEELFPERSIDATQLSFVNTFDLTYYPNERGPYNYTTAGSTNPTNEIDNPEDNFGGITRGLITTDFKSSNIQYIEFWVQDPYDNYSIRNGSEGIVNSTDFNNQKGSLYINLGSISEDINRDGRKSFENGLSEEGLLTEDVVDETNVAYIPTEKSLLYAFDTDDTARGNQDVGYDGVGDVEEKNKFPLLSSLEDPSSDNYHFFRGSDLDSNGASILTRYKSYNNLEGNSPTASMSPEDYPTSASTLPDVEDVDRDQTMNTLDAYWQYKIDLSKSNLDVNTNEHIVDQVLRSVTLENGETKEFEWYLFRIPIFSGDKEEFGGIGNFQSIRFMRMFLTDFENPINLRLADFQMVRGDWRIYDNIIDENEVLTTGGTDIVETGVVNAEENENRVPINYVLPPTIERQQLQGTSSILQENEQSLTMTIENLEQNNTVGLYKNVNVDMRMFKNLKMFIHAEEKQLNTVEDDELIAIIRLGSDITDNFYQIEIPLKISEVENLNVPNLLSDIETWPEENNLEISLEDFPQLKIDRDNDDFTSTELYPESENIDNSSTVIRVKGSPNLSNIRTVFLGVKNNSSGIEEKNAEIWFNELRMSGYDNQGGWATNVSADATIADLAKVSLTGGYQSIGFGNIDETINERSQEEIKNYSVNTSVNAGKLLPKNWNLRIPVNYTVSEEIRTPKFDPKYEDLLSKNTSTSNIETRSKRRGISFINVKKERSVASSKKPQIYDIENFSFSYDYSDVVNESYVVEKDMSQRLNAKANYAFKFQQIEVEPLKNVSFLKDKKLSLLREFNFNLLPTDISINSNINRSYSEYKTRDLSDLPEGSIEIPTLKQRNFMFNWDYRIGYKLTKAINLNFNASNSYVYDDFERNIITDEDEERLDRIGIYSNFFQLGRPSNYNQQLSVDYKIPINKIPLLSFLSANYSYTGNFVWQGTSPDYVEDVGNSISNGNTHNLSASMSFSKLYKEIGLDALFYKKGKSKRLSKSKNKTSFKDIVYGLLTSVKTGQFSYSNNGTSSLNGYTPQTGFLGRNSYSGSYAPSLAYVFGQQTTNLVDSFIDNGWIVGSDEGTSYSKNYTQTNFNSLNYNLTLKPIKDLNIQFSADRSFSKSIQQQAETDAQVDEYGNFNISYSLIKTAYGSDKDALFDTFIENRFKIVNEIHPNYEAVIADANESANEDGVLTDTEAAAIIALEEQGLNSQEVLIHSFLAAYSGNDATQADKNVFKNIPIPNWQLTYKGLMRIKFFKENFSNFTISHGYNSSYTINNFSKNLQSDDSNQFQSDNIYSAITLTDVFSPLIKVDFKMKNSFTFRGTINKSRTLSLNLNNTTLSEIIGSEYIFGIGYRLKDVKWKTKFLGKSKTLKGDINIKADVSYRTDVTSIRYIDALTSQVVGGQNLLGIKVAADYNLSRNFTASLYYDQNVSSYAISTLYPSQSINAGLSLVYNLGN